MRWFPVSPRFRFDSVFSKVDAQHPAPKSRAKPVSRHGTHCQRRLRVEPLEQRQLLAVTVIDEAYKMVEFEAPGSVEAFALVGGEPAHSGSATAGGTIRYTGPWSSEGAYWLVGNGTYRYYDPDLNLHTEGWSISGHGALTEQGPAPFSATKSELYTSQDVLLTAGEAVMPLVSLLADGDIDAANMAAQVGYDLDDDGLPDGRWDGSITYPNAEPYDVFPTLLVWHGDRIQLEFRSTGRPVTATDRDLPETAVEVYWASAPSTSAIIGPAIGRVPVYWNQAGGAAEITDFGGVPEGAKYLLAWAWPEFRDGPKYEMYVPLSAVVRDYTFKSWEFTATGTVDASGDTLFGPGPLPEEAEPAPATNVSGTISYESPTRGTGVWEGEVAGLADVGLPDPLLMTGSVRDAFGAMSVEAVFGADPEVPDAVLHLDGQFDPSDGSALLKWRSAGFYDYDATWGSWSGSLTPVTTEAVDIAVTSLERLENGISVQYAASGPPMAAPDHLTPAADVRLYWASGPTPDAVLGDAHAFSLPVYWNLESATVDLTDLTAPPPGTTHLLAIADRAGAVTEGDEANNVAALAISIAPQPDAYATDQNWPLDVGPDEGVLANDAGQEEATLTAILETAPAHGGFELYPDGSFSYTPDPDYVGIDRFSYRAADSGYVTAPVEVVLHVNPVLELPPSGKGYNLLLRRSGPNLQLVHAANPKQVFFAARDGDVSRLTIFAQDDRADTLTVDMSYGAPTLPDGVFFGGGFGGAADSLVIRGTAAGDVFTVDIDAVDVNGIPVSFEDVERLTLDGGRGNDVYRFVDLGADTTLIDNKGTDLLDFSEALAGVAIDLSKSGGQAQRVFDLSSDYTLGLRGLFENVNGSPEADLIKGNALANEIRGGDGDDVLYGAAGNDILYGGPGDDWLYGDADNDKLYGGSGNNVLLGGVGNDRLDVREEAEAEDRNLLIGGAGTDALYGGLGEAILIGGKTAYDGKPAALAAVMEAWTSGDPFGSRCGQLEGGFTDSMGTFVQLKPKTKTDRKGTVLDDGLRDTLFGDPASDWLFLFKKDQIAEA